MTPEQKVEALKSLAGMKAHLKTMPPIVQSAVKMCQEDLEKILKVYNTIEGSNGVSTLAIAILATETMIANSDNVEVRSEPKSTTIN